MKINVFFTASTSGREDEDTLNAGKSGFISIKVICGFSELR